jgi:hypothetical protein
MDNRTILFCLGTLPDIHIFLAQGRRRIGLPISHQYWADSQLLIEIMPAKSNQSQFEFAIRLIGTSAGVFKRPAEGSF